MEANRRILSLALEALYIERRKLDEEIDDLRRRLGPPAGKQHLKPANARPKKRSTQNRNAISEAMKKHWIERRRRMAKKS